MLSRRWFWVWLALWFCIATAALVLWPDGGSLPDVFLVISAAMLLAFAVLWKVWRRT